VLNKKDMKPGVLLKVRNEPRDGISSNVRNHVSVWVTENVPTGPGSTGQYPAYPNDILVLIEGPRKKNNANLARVHVRGTDYIGEVYWCELRVSCDLVS
jgi:hypothetical protein